MSMIKEEWDQLEKLEKIQSDLNSFLGSFEKYPNENVKIELDKEDLEIILDSISVAINNVKYKFDPEID